jgi:hypothetical protein
MMDGNKAEISPAHLTNCLHIHGQMPIISLFVTGVQVEVNYQEM